MNFSPGLSIMWGLRILSAYVIFLSRAVSKGYPNQFLSKLRYWMASARRSGCMGTGFCARTEHRSAIERDFEKALIRCTTINIKFYKLLDI